MAVRLEPTARTPLGAAEPVAFLNSILEGSAEFSIVAEDLDGTIQVWNEGARRIYGYEAADVVGKLSAFALHDSKDVRSGRAQGILDEAGRTGKWEGELQRVRRDGTTFTAHATITLRSSSTGDPVGFTMISRDLTAPLRVEMELRESREHSLKLVESNSDAVIKSDQSARDRAEEFSQLADNVSEVFFVVDAHCRAVLYVNAAYEIISGRSRQSLYDDPGKFLELIAPEERAAFGDAILKLRRGQEPGELGFRLCLESGSVRWILIHAKPDRDAAGRVYRYSGIARDVTEQRQSRMDLEESVVRYQKLTEAMYDAIAIAQDGVYREVNPGFVRMFGYDSAEEIVGRPVVDFVSAKSREEVATRVADGIEGSVEIECVRKDGKKITCEVTSRMHTLGGKPARIAALRDITEQRLLQAQFRQAQKMEAVGRLAGGVAHDFNNLLTVIMGNAEILTQGMMKDDPRAADLEQIRKAADSAAVLTRQLLTFSRQQVVEPRTVALSDIIAKTQRMLGQLIGEDVKVITRFTEQPCSVHIDPGQIEQVIMNLAVNARDAMPTGGTLNIETSVVALEAAQALWHSLPGSGRYALLAVRDNGTGMDRVTLDRIFEPFFTTKESGKGTGLGLATVYGIVKQSGGSIEAYSELGMGTTFRIYLPLVDDAGVPDSDTRDLQEAPRGTETVLLVEDSVAVREVTRRTLERHGYAVLETTSATQALVIAQRSGVVINLLLTDVVMPQMSGRVVAEGFKLHHPNGKVLYMSGYTDDAIVRHGVLNSGTPYLQKPFTSHALACKVRGVLDAV